MSVKSWVFLPVKSGPEGPLLCEWFDLHRERTWLPDTGHELVTIFMLCSDILSSQSTNWSSCVSRKFHLHAMGCPGKVQLFVHGEPTLWAVL